MVQLSPFLSLDVSSPPQCSNEVEKIEDEMVMSDSPKVKSPGRLSEQQHNLETSIVYYGYETYIEDGLICLKHKVRNLEKKKVRVSVDN